MAHKTQKELEFYTQGLAAQHMIFSKMKNKYANLTRYNIEESTEGSLKDMVDKIDITVYDRANSNVVCKTYDVKSTKSPDRISYTYINSLGQRSKIFKGIYDTDLIFTFGNNNTGYIVNAEEFNRMLCEKIQNGKGTSGKYKPKSRYVMFEKNEIEAMAYDVI